MFRQGDVLLIPISPPASLGKPIARDKDRRLVLAEGEVTGHAHVVRSFDAAMFHDQDLAKRFLQVGSKTQMEHDEHDPIPLDAGWYEIRVQRQYDPTTKVSRIVGD